MKKVLFVAALALCFAGCCKKCENKCCDKACCEQAPVEEVAADSAVVVEEVVEVVEEAPVAEVAE